MPDSLQVTRWAKSELAPQVLDMLYKLLKAYLQQVVAWDGRGNLCVV